MSSKRQSSSFGGIADFFQELAGLPSNSLSFEICKCPSSTAATLFESSEDDNLHKVTLEYSWLEMSQATVGFSEASVIGRGHASTVYRGRLEEGIDAAIKVIDVPLDGFFSQEVQLLSRCHHPNVVMLLGFATEYMGEPMDGDSYPEVAYGVPASINPASAVAGLRSRSGRGRRALVYELLPDGSALERLHLHKPYGFRERLCTAIGASRGLAHLHKHRPEVFHRDIKTANILFGRDGNAKIADFGLACASGSRAERWSSVKHTSGTPGYAAPEYARTSVVTEASEVYSMGMVLIELLTAMAPAQPCTDGLGTDGFTFLLETIRPELDRAEERLFSMVDARAQWPKVTASGVARFSLLCIHEDVKRRPTFVEMVRMLMDFLATADLSEVSVEQAPTSPSNSTPQSQPAVATPQNLVAIEPASLVSLPHRVEALPKGAAPSNSNKIWPPAANAAVPAADSATAANSIATESGDSFVGHKAISKWPFTPTADALPESAAGHGSAVSQEGGGWRGVWNTIMRRSATTPAEFADSARPESPPDPGGNAIAEEDEEETEASDDGEREYDDGEMETKKTQGGRWRNWLPFGSREFKKEADEGNGKEDGDVDLSRISAPCHAELMRAQSTNPAVTVPSSACNASAEDGGTPLAALDVYSTVGGAHVAHTIPGHRRTASSPAAVNQRSGSKGAAAEGEELARLVENALNISSRPNSFDEPNDAGDNKDAPVTPRYPEHATVGRLRHICELSP